MRGESSEAEDVSMQSIYISMHSAHSSSSSAARIVCFRQRIDWFPISLERRCATQLCDQNCALCQMDYARSRQ
eukprot:6203250-Pleurochrysis_carterae.AAC.2